MALMSCGPAFMALVAESFADAGAAHGLAREDAIRMTVDDHRPARPRCLAEHGHVRRPSCRAQPRGRYQVGADRAGPDRARGARGLRETAAAPPWTPRPEATPAMSVSGWPRSHGGRSSADSVDAADCSSTWS